MTSRPGPGIRESLQHGSAGHARPDAQQPSSQPVNNDQHTNSQDGDVPLDDQRRTFQEKTGTIRGQLNTHIRQVASSEGLHASAIDGVRAVPKGKPQLFFSNLPGDAPEFPPQPTPFALPLPPRPGYGTASEAAQQLRVPPGGSGFNDNIGGKALSNEVPGSAPIFPGGKTADVFPWTGNNPEDTLSEALVKHGVSNKSQIMNETLTARVSLWPNLKSRSGLASLGTLFTTVLEKRQACGRLTAPNSFKPPPRLTLRDSTREAWLHDLANPTVGLRRLSRTIPHGITGTVLLDHCLNKSIPLPRAVWLAKCVGINEMRSHKRKGQAGTITWVKGWTSAVQQFLDSTIATIGQQDWKPRITYALQLATSLYKEHLLEDDQFLDWILKNIDNCPPERLFLWLLITSLYGQDLTASRRRGKRLADALLSHANKLYQFGEEIQASPLLEYLEKILLKLLATTPSCLLLPRTWDVNLPVLQHLVSRHPHTQVLSSVNDLDRRVKRLQHRLGAHSDSKDPTRRVISLLDSLEYVTAVDMERTACDCLATMPDAHTLVSTVLKWAASLYREGVHRIYLATRLLRRWCRSGVDVDSAILSYFLSPDSSQGCDPRNIFRIVAELIRSKNFSVGKYLQWLIATGSIHRNQDISSSSSWPLRLITEIPLTGLPEQVRNLRNTLLRGTPQCIEEEERTLDIAESTIRSQLQGLFGTEDIEDEGSSKCDVAHLHSTIKLELAYLLRHQVAANVQTLDRVPTKDPSVHESGQVCMITVKDFFTVRSYLESFGDLSMLADIVGIVATSLDSRVLTQATDTLLYHEKALRAIGAFESLFSRIATRYAVLRTVRIPEREFLLSLTELSLAAKGDSHLIQALRHDLSLCEQKNSLAACSPASDTMMEAASNPSIGSEEEIERVLTSGTTMDRQVMVRLFEKITFNLEDQMTKRSVPTGYHAMWFYRLRVFDENTFDIIVAERLTALLLNHRTATSQAILPALITSRCVALSNYVKIAGDCIRDRKAVDGIDALAICMDVLDLLLPSHELIASCQVGEAYRYRLEQWKLLYEAGNGILEVLGQMLELGAGSLPQTSQARLRHLLSDQRMQVFVKHFALKDLPSLCSALGLGMRSYSDATRLALKALADHLLDPSNRLPLSENGVEQQIKMVVENASYLSLPFSQLDIRLLFSFSGCDPALSIESLSAAFLEAIKSSVHSGAPCFDLVTGLDYSVTSKVRAHAERELLDTSAFLGGSANLDLDVLRRDSSSLISKYLAIIDLTSQTPAKEEQVQMVSSLVERLKGMVELLGKTDHQPDRALVPLLCPWLNALLRLAVMHCLMELHKIPSQHQVALLWSLKRLMTHPALVYYPTMMEFVFDVALLLHDSISDDARQHFTKLDAVKSLRDPRCTFLFGSSPSIDRWLALAKPVTLATNSQPTPSSQPATPSTDQNQNPMQQTQLQQPLQNRTTPGASPHPLQRSLSQQQRQLQTPQTQNSNRMYPQYPANPQYPHQRMWSPYPQMPSASGQAQNPQMSQYQQMQRMQQIQQSMAQQQRNMQGPPVPQQTQQQQRQMAPTLTQPSGTSQGGAGKGTAGAGTVPTKQDAVEMRVFPFAVKPWEILPESGGNAQANETAISLGLFGARKV